MASRKTKSKIQWPEAALNPRVPLTVESAYEIGRLISSNYDDDVSLESIRDAENIKLQKISFFRCLAVYRVCCNLGAKKNWENMEMSQLRALDALSPPQQKKLAAQIRKENWTVLDTQAEVTRLVQKRNASRKERGRGRPPRHPLLKISTRLSQFLDGRFAINKALTGLGELKPEQVKEILATSKKLRDELTKAEKALKKRS